MTDTNEPKGTVEAASEGQQRQPEAPAPTQPQPGEQPDAPSTPTEAAPQPGEAGGQAPGSDAGAAASEEAGDTASEAREDGPRAEEATGATGEAAEDAGAADAGAQAEGAATGDAPDAAGPAADGGEAPRRKKRRRRRKKKKAAGEGAAAGSEQGKVEEKPRAEAPLGRWFEGHVREHAFKKDEIVAGRLLEVREEGVLVLDLFGRGTAFMDAREPEDIAELPALESAGEAAGEAEAAPAGDTPAEGTPVEGTPAEGGSSEAPGAQGEAQAGDEASGTAAEAQAADDGQAPPTAEAAVHARAVATGGAADGEAEAKSAEAAPADQGVAAPSGEQPAAAEGSAEGEAVEAAPSGEQAATEGSAKGGADAEAASAPQQQDGAQAAEEPTGPPPDTLLLEAPRQVPLGHVVTGRIRSVADSGHMVLVNRPVDRKAAKAALRAARERGEKVEGLVFGFNRGGFDVLVQGIRAFCPASGMSLQPIEDPERYLGRRMRFSVAPKKGSSIVVSRRSQLEKERRKRIKERLAALQKGERLTGTVTQVRDFGLIVDVGDGVEGLVHLSELSYKRGVKPSEVAEVGQRIDVVVLEAVPPSRKDRHGKLSLSVRATLPDPWDEHPEVLREGVVMELPVVRVTDFGAFLEMAEGIDGLLPAGEIVGRAKGSKPSDFVQEGDRLKVVVERVDRKGHKIWLSKPTELELQWLEQGVLDPEKRPKSLKPGQHVPVLVQRVEHGGVVVQVQGMLGRRGRGFVPNRELVGEDGPIDRKSLEPGTEMMVKIIGTDRAGGLRCSVRARLVDEERKAVREYRKEAARQGFGTFGDLLRAKLDQAGQGGDGG